MKNIVLLSDTHHNMKRVLITLLLLLFSFFLFSQSTTVNFNYTGSAQNWVVPACVTSITISVAGAKGGGINGEKGAVLTGNISVIAGQTLQINVGGQGGTPTAGWNGGGAGGAQGNFAGQYLPGGGGGSSDIRISPNGLANRIIVSAGGGGAGGGGGGAGRAPQPVQPC